MEKIEVKLFPFEKKKWEKPCLIYLDIKKTENGLNEEEGDLQLYGS